MKTEEHIDFLTIGHICLDMTAAGLRIGGAAAYCSAVAEALGCRTAVVTSSAETEEWQVQLPDTAIHCLISPNTTVFENIYTPTGRIQKIHSVAGPIKREDIPQAWHRAPAVLLSPIAREVDPRILYLFSNSLVGVAPQGWLRSWDAEGHVGRTTWPEAEQYLRLAAAVFVSKEDLTGPEMFAQYRSWSRLLVLTQAEDGCTVYFGDEIHHEPAWPGTVVDATGAGDVFAAAFMVRLHQTGGNPIESARFANEIASIAIGAAGVQGKMEAISSYLAG